MCAIPPRLTVIPNGTQRERDVIMMTPLPTLNPITTSRQPSPPLFCTGSLQTAGRRHSAAALLQDRLAAAGRARPLPLPARLPEPQGRGDSLRYPPGVGPGTEAPRLSHFNHAPPLPSLPTSRGLIPTPTHVRKNHHSPPSSST